MSMEMDFLRRSARCSRLEKITNNVIREKIDIKNSVLEYVRYKQLNWYGQLQRMDEEENADLEICGCRKLQQK